VVLDADPAVGWQMALISFQSLALTRFATAGAKMAFDRERPSQTACRESSPDGAGCSTEATSHQSFFSGHTSLAFTGAGLICAHHLNLDLYGSRAADVAMCGTALAAATTVGALRLAGDRHYLTDVLVGAGVGFASGYLVPTLLHYLGTESSGGPDEPLWSGLRPTLGETLGVELNGSF
jgi:membrane-associated phospholipid phosphatase